MKASPLTPLPRRGEQKHHIGADYQGLGRGSDYVYRADYKSARTGYTTLCHPERSEGSRIHMLMLTDPSTSSG